MYHSHLNFLMLTMSVRYKYDSMIELIPYHAAFFIQ